MTDTPPGRDDDAARDAAIGEALHRLRSALNGLTLQLEVAKLAIARADETRLVRAMDGAAQANAHAARELEALARALLERS
jgi:hypothetical protein